MSSLHQEFLQRLHHLQRQMVDAKNGYGDLYSFAAVVIVKLPRRLLSALHIALHHLLAELLEILCSQLLGRLGSRKLRSSIRDWVSTRCVSRSQRPVRRGNL